MPTAASASGKRCFRASAARPNRRCPLARLDIAGGNIRNIALNGAFLAAGENQRIGMEHLVNAARQEYAKIDKMVTQAEFGPYYQLAGRKQPG